MKTESKTKDETWKTEDGDEDGRTEDKRRRRRLKTEDAMEDGRKMHNTVVFIDSTLYDEIWKI